jgi:hypothetical protein
MKLRKKAKYEIESYFKMFELRNDLVRVLYILTDSYRREELKKKLNLVDQAIFEAQFENALRERGVNYQSKNQKLDLKKIDLIH